MDFCFQIWAAAVWAVPGLTCIKIRGCVWYPRIARRILLPLGHYDFSGSGTYSIKSPGWQFKTPHNDAIENGMKPQTLKMILGHSNLSMTMDLYSHVLPTTKAEKTDLIAKAF